MAEIGPETSHRLVGWLGRAGLVMGGLVLVGGVPTFRWARMGGLRAAGAAAVICWSAACLSLVPVARALGRGAVAWVQGCLVGMAVRLVLTLAGGIGWYLLVGPGLTVFVIWMTAGYLALLIWETALLVRLSRWVLPGGRPPGRNTSIVPIERLNPEISDDKR